ncbi:hypothetical protein E2C01_082375 [Portunus trituberculatus]|uniref:Uncharacterized protein n=1 Tax=Portunus trituberculatus TaxID=210409 RepID=A0A5B7IUD9_PORTR|nr:hypothetical protein [Portunus trituberculatus]
MNTHDSIRHTFKLAANVSRIQIDAQLRVFNYLFPPIETEDTWRQVFPFKCSDEKTTMNMPPKHASISRTD